MAQTKILIVEDSPTQAARLRYLLESSQYDVHVAQNGHEALEWLTDNRPDLIISDIVMPEMNGFELCERVKTDKNMKNIPVILLTSLTDPEEAVEGLSCGADNFITKPYSKDFLLLSVSEILRQNGDEERDHIKKDMIISYDGKERVIKTSQQKVIKFLFNIYKGAVHQNSELIRTRDELKSLNDKLEDIVEERTRELRKNEEKILAFNAELEQRIAERTVQLDAANKAKSEFLANMSHEIRTPMNAVLGYAELLGSLIEDKNQRDYLESIKSSGKSLLTLINDILDLSKIEAGRLELQFDFVNARNFFAEFERIFSLRVSEKGLKFILDVASGTPQGIYIDDTRLRQIILNLIGNAVKFTDQGNIKLKVYTENPQIVNHPNNKTDEFIDLLIEVSDTGIGISKEQQNEIFQPFIQGQGQKVKDYGGTGLGLAITNRLVQLMNGTITLESQLNKGSCFKIKIPDVSYLRNFDKKQEEFTIDPSSIIFEKSTILVADDVEHNRKYLIDALKETNLKVIEAENGHQALGLAKKTVPDLIIADIRMPILDGFGLLKKLKSDNTLKHIPVIAYSASVMKNEKDKIRESEFIGLLVKPVQVAELYIELMNLLPYKVKESADTKTSEAEIESAGKIDDMSGLIHELDTHLKDQWITFGMRQPLDEIQDFGNKLMDLGKKHRADKIIGYGADLIDAADNFNIEGILNLIKKYPGIIDSLKEIDEKGNKN